MLCCRRSGNEGKISINRVIVRLTVVTLTVVTLCVRVSNGYTPCNSGFHQQRQCNLKMPSNNGDRLSASRTTHSSSWSSSSFVANSRQIVNGHSGSSRSDMQMGLFSCVRGGVDVGKSGCCRARRFAANNMRRLSSMKKNGEARRKQGVDSGGRRAIRKLVSKTRLQLQSLLIVWRRKYRSCSVAAATAVFAASILSRTLSNTLPEPEQQLQQLQRQPQTTLTQRGIRASSASLERHITAVSGGGSQQKNERARLMASAFGGHSKKEEQLTVDSTTAIAQETAALAKETKKTLKAALSDLQSFMRGAKSDTLLLLLTTSLVTPLCKKLGTSPILGFLAAGMALGPNALGLISGIHSTETLAELGIVFFLFEMGIELSFDRLISMRKDVFGLGLSQFAVTAAVIAAVGALFGIPANALIVLGGGLALSSSAFVLQLLKDNNQLASRFGKAAFGVLLFQDLAVVPLLVVTPILAGGGTGLASAVGSALVKAAMALGAIAFSGRVLLNPLFRTVASANSQEAFLGVILLTVLSMSFMTEGLGLSNTLGAFLAGVLLSETKYRYQIEADIAPFRGVLLGLFFVTVGFEIDFHLIASNLPLVAFTVAGIIFTKTAITTLMSLAFGLSLATSQQTGLILSQGGEFAFVAFGLARNLGILDPATTKLMLTSVSLTMAVTPALANLGAKISKRIEESSDFTHYLGQDRDAAEIKESEDFVVVAGYGSVGKVVCELLDKKLYRYVGLELDPGKAIEARNKGLPIFYGDIGRPEVAEAFNVGNARAVIVTIADRDQANRAVIALRRAFPDTKIFARAKDADHAERLQRTLDVIAMVPVVPEDNVLMTLPFGGAVLRSLGAAQEEVNAILEGTRKEILAGRVTGDEEERMVLTQLGILAETDEDDDVSSTLSSAGGVEIETETNKQDDQPLQDVARAAADANKEIAPMVAEVIEAAAGKVDKTTQADQQLSTSSEVDADASIEIAPVVGEVIEAAAAGKVETTTQPVDIEVIQNIEEESEPVNPIGS